MKRNAKIHNLKVRYRAFFAIHEIEDSLILQLAFGASLLSFFVTFFLWSARLEPSATAVAQNAYTCWPYFQNCGFLQILTSTPYGYSHTFLYALLLGLLTYTAYAIFKKDWISAHAALSLAWLWKVLVVFVFSMHGGGNFDYYDIYLAFVLLFLPLKLFFVRLVFVVLYFLSATIKFDDGWIAGTFFTSLAPGLALFGNTYAPLVTNGIIFAETIGGWFLLSRKRLLQKSALLFFILFHLYSSIYVTYRYPLTMIPMLLILFGPLFKPLAVPLEKKAIAGWLFLVLLFLLQFIPLLIPGNHRLTLEGNQYGLYMFEANHQCISESTVYFNNNTEKTSREEHENARDRCDPYAQFFKLAQVCKRFPGAIRRISWSFDHSLNGGPFYRIVDEKDACILTYRPFMHNVWIRTYEDSPPIIGYPVTNFYY